jgi:hypothetical protein
MSEIDDGGTAFPSEYYACQGMSLRDYFAAAALTGIRANDSVEWNEYSGIAKCAYLQADAMLAARKEGA